jgi:glutamate-1-semialdehyde 2,1-aminomutase
MGDLTTAATRSAMLFRRALDLFPGGVNSPVRSFRSVGGTPRFIARGRGARIQDEDGRTYVDYVLSWGALILGHAAAPVVRAISRQAARGTTFGAPTRLENELAERIRAAMPSIELLRFTSSGTEAVMSAVRLARAATGRPKILTFAGGYHGHADPLLVEAGSGVATLGLPTSPGIPPAVTANTLVARYNDLAQVKRIAAETGNRLAAILVEPVAGNMGLVLPRPEWLSGLRRIADQTGALLVFDEVMTGFRVGPGGAQGRYRVTPDLTTLGKVIGGGLPIGAYGGRRELLELIAPAGPVYQAGTLSGNPLAMAAGIATLDRLARPGAWERLEATAHRVVRAVREAGRAAGIPLQAEAVGAMWGLAFSPTPIRNFDDARRADTGRYAAAFHRLLEHGVYLAPSPFEAGFVSLAHGDRHLERTEAALERAFAGITDRELAS